MLVFQFCQVADIEIGHHIEGKSIWPTLRGERQNLDERNLYWVRKEGGQPFLGLNQHSVRQGNIKLLHNSPFEPLELYDLSTDPQESHNIVHTEPNLFRQMSDILQSEIQHSGTAVWQSK